MPTFVALLRTSHKTGGARCEQSLSAKLAAMVMHVISPVCWHASGCRCGVLVHQDGRRVPSNATLHRVALVLNVPLCVGVGVGVSVWGG